MLTELDAANALRTLSELQTPELPPNQASPSLRRIAIAAANAALLFATEVRIGDPAAAGRVWPRYLPDTG